METPWQSGLGVGTVVAELAARAKRAKQAIMNRLVRYCDKIRLPPPARTARHQLHMNGALTHAETLEFGINFTANDDCKLIIGAAIGGVNTPFSFSVQLRCKGR